MTICDSDHEVTPRDELSCDCGAYYPTYKPGWVYPAICPGCGEFACCAACGAILIVTESAS